MRREIECVVTGRVQFVLFRDFTRRKARAAGLAGFVRNEPDGSVRVVAQGEEAALRALVRCLEKELPLARVDGVEVAWRDIVEPFLDFRIVCGWRTFF